MKMRWLGRGATTKIEKRLGRNLARFDDAILADARALIGVQGPPRSSPGSPPHVDSSRLLDSLYHEVDTANLRSRLGSTESHAAYTEFGTTHMAARPWLVPAIYVSMNIAARELAK